MLDNKLLEEVIPSIESWSYGDLKEIRVLSEDTVKEIAAKVESGDYCDYDIISLCATSLYYMRRKVAFGGREEFKLNLNPPIKTVTYETTGVDKCIPVTCNDEDYEFKRCMR